MLRVTRVAIAHVAHHVTWGGTGDAERMTENPEGWLKKW